MMSMNSRVTAEVQSNARSYYEGSLRSVEAFENIDRVANSAFNWYAGILNDAREAFDRFVDGLILDDIEKRRRETYESRQLRRVRDAGADRGRGGAEWFRLKVTGIEESKWLLITPAQLDALIQTFEV
jgi:hypothetical protein